MIGTCVVVIAMLDAVFPGTLPGVQPRKYTQSDTATFTEVYAVALSLALQCVKSKEKPEAGWSFTGKSATSSARRLALQSTPKDCC